MIVKHRYSEEEKEFLRENASQYTYKELADAFHQKFGVEVSCGAIQQYCTKVLCVKANNPNFHIYTDAEKAWLRAHIDDGSFEEIAKLFNAEFGTNVRMHSISDVCSKRMRLKKKTNEGMFTSGSPLKCKNYPIGSERKYGGYWYVKVADTYHPGKTSMKEFRENWKLKHTNIYEQAHGPIPDGSFVVFLDTNRENFSIDNLYCIDRKILAVMNNNRWFKSDPDLTMAAIKWCELHYAIKDAIKHG